MDVEFEQFTLTPNIQSVLSTAKTIQITLTLNGEFADGLTVGKASEFISLKGAFEGLTIESLSASGANLTMQLAGDLKPNETAGAFTDGSITIYPSAIKNANEAVTASIPVEQLSAYFVGEELQKTSSNTFTLPLVLIDSGIDLSTLNKSEFAFYRSDEENNPVAAEDISVTALNKTSDTEVLLTLNVDGANDENAAAEKINGVNVKIGEFEFTANVASATFYPVFDYVDKTGNDLEFTLELYAHSGTFKSEISASDFAFTDESFVSENAFENASIVSVKRVSDTVAELKIKIPADNRTVEDLDVSGLVSINAGALKNLWGSATADKVNYYRRYTQEDIGRYTLLGSGDVEILKDVVGGFGNTAAGTVASIASGAASAGTAILTILDITGIMPNKTSQTLTLLKEVDEKINSIQDQLNRQSALMQDIQRSIYDSNLSSFDTQVANLNTLNGIVSGFLATAATDPDIGLTFPYTKEQLEQMQEKVGSSGRYTYKNLTAEQGEELQAYTSDLVQKVLDAERNDSRTYRGFSKAYEQLESVYRSILVQVTKTNDQNPMAIFDKLCSYTYNFSTSAFGTRYAQRLNIANAVEKALDNIALYYGCDSNNSVFKSAEASYETFLELINDNTSNGDIGKFAVTKQNRAWNENFTAYFYILGRDVVLTDYYIYQSPSNPQKWYVSTVYRYQWDPYDRPASNLWTNSAFYTTTRHQEGVAKFSRNFGDDEIEEFVRRMNGRTLREELELAGFTGEITEAGLIFKAWSKDDGGYRWWQARYANKYYAIVIKLNSKTAEHILRGQQDGGTFLSKDDRLYILPAFWYSPWRK